jgi:hypothetical protein
MNVRRIVAAGVAGGVVGIAIGYVMLKIPDIDFPTWINVFRYEAGGWLVGGVMIGVVATHLRR